MLFWEQFGKTSISNYKSICSNIRKKGDPPVTEETSVDSREEGFTEGLGFAPHGYVVLKTHQGDFLGSCPSFLSQNSGNSDGKPEIGLMCFHHQARGSSLSAVFWAGSSFCRIRWTTLVWWNLTSRCLFDSGQNVRVVGCMASNSAVLEVNTMVKAKPRDKHFSLYMGEVGPHDEILALRLLCLLQDRFDTSWDVQQ